MTAARKTEHVILKAPNTIACLRCGETYETNLPAPVDVLLAAMKAFGKSHNACVLTKRGVACSHCFEFGHTNGECPRTEYGGDWRRWADGPDTGVSSIAICRKLMPKGASYEFDVSCRVWADSTPSDPSDFGRCYRLLHAIPGWRARIGEMATEPNWTKLAEHWDELEALYEEELPSGTAPKLYKRIQELRS